MDTAGRLIDCRGWLDYTTHENDTPKHRGYNKQLKAYEPD